MSVVDTAIAALQDIALTCTNIKRAPDYPVEDATVLPLAIAHISSGDGTANNASTVQMNLTVNVDFHFARVNIKDAYTRIDTLIPEYLKKLAGNPTLDEAVDTIQFPVPFNVQPAPWDQVVTQMVSFAVTFKVLDTPTT